jgi:two-component system, OmpR family, sensor histidine kinase KdpD
VLTLSKARVYRLFQLAQQLLVLEPKIEAGSALLDPFLGVFGTTAICLFDASTGGFHTIGSSSSGLEDPTRGACVSGQDVDDPEAGITIRGLVAGGRITGAIAFRGLEDPQLTAGPLVSLAAAVHERMRLRRQADEAAVAAEIEAFRSAIFDVLGDEFKNALTTILTATGGLREAGPLSAAQSVMASAVEEEASRLGSVISRLDRIAWLDDGEVSPRMDTTDLTTLLAQAVEQCSLRSPDRKFVFTSSGEVLKVLADAELIRLALSQLLENAYTYSGPGSGVLVAVEERGAAVVISVSAGGKPVPSHERHRIFERSHIGSRAPSFTGGSGLGLYVARKIVVAHGGTLDFDPELMGNDLMAFRLSLPRANGQPGES